MLVFRRGAYRTAFLCGTVVVFGGSPVTLNARSAQDSQQQGVNPDVNRGEIANFDGFLDSHTDIDKELRSNPSLINSTEYLENHPELRTYLRQHPRVQEELTENPSYFMQRERRFDAREPRSGGGTDRDVTRRQLTSMDGFLDTYPDIDKQLRANPSLVNNPDYLKAHPQLQDYLNDHPGIREEIKENPQYFMNRANRFDAAEPPRRSANPDLTRRDLTAMDGFLDTYPDIDKQLRANPNLVNNSDYLKAHPQLQAYLNDHPQIREEIKENPQYFMNRENRFDAAEPPRRSANPDLTRRDLTAMDGFLDTYPDIDKQLRANPNLVNNSDYLKAHPQLQAYLNDHPQIREEIKENPQYFMNRENRFDAAEPPRRGANPDLTRRDLSAMDGFLDTYPDIDKQLRANPNLVNNSDYLKAHPQLQAYLNDHPQIREEIKENPRYFMNRENRFDAAEPPRRAGNPNPDLTNQEVSSMDRFLDRNQDVARDLQRNPGLVNNAGYLKSHPNLQDYLSDHPAVREEVKENPNYFMRRESQYEASNADRSRDADRDRSSDRDRDSDRTRDADRDRNTDRDRDIDRNRANPNPDLTTAQVASMDQFLDDHKQIAKDLEKKPTLVNDQGYLKHHKDLENYLGDHPQVREEVKENPDYFMRRENRYEAREDRTRVASQDPDLNKKELQQMDEFLDKHKKVAKELEKNPSLANDSSFLDHHKDLRAFLDKNPQVGHELKENPSLFMQKEARLEQMNHRTNRPPAENKTKLEQKEDTHAGPPH